MSSIPIIDASVAFLWFFDEVGEEAARALLDSDETLIAPSLILSEVGNAFWKRRARDPGIAARAFDAIDRLPMMLNEIVELPPLAKRATELAFALKHPVYDCYYVALAERERTHMITSDQRLLRVLAASPHAALARAL